MGKFEIQVRSVFHGGANQATMKALTISGPKIICTAEMEFYNVGFAIYYGLHALNSALQVLSRRPHFSSRSTLLFSTGLGFTSLHLRVAIWVHDLHIVSSSCGAHHLDSPKSRHTESWRITSISGSKIMGASACHTVSLVSPHSASTGLELGRSTIVDHKGASCWISSCDHGC